MIKLILGPGDPTPELPRDLARADCWRCGGTGIVEGNEVRLGPEWSPYDYVRDADRVCSCCGQIEVDGQRFTYYLHSLSDGRVELRADHYPRGFEP